MSVVVRSYSSTKARKRISFNKEELRQLFAVYSRRVATGEWRDYAIDHGPERAVFSIFRHTAEHPLYAVAKLSPDRANVADTCSPAALKKSSRAPR